MSKIALVLAQHALLQGIRLEIIARLSLLEWCTVMSDIVSQTYGKVDNLRARSSPRRQCPTNINDREAEARNPAGFAAAHEAFTRRRKTSSRWTRPARWRSPSLR